MPKQTYKLLRFEGGLNNNTSPRDLVENQLADLKNVAVDEVGRILVIGAVSEVIVEFTGTVNITSGAGKGGRGFKIISTDNDKFSVNPNGASGAVTTGGAEKRYYLAEHSGGILIRDTDGGGESEEDLTAVAINEAEMYYHNGALRIIDADLTKDTTTNKSQWRGFIPGKVYGNDERAVNVAFQGHIQIVVSRR